MEAWLVTVGLIVIVAFSGYFLGWVTDNWRKAKKYDELEPKLDAVESQESDLKNRQMEWEKKVQSDTEAIKALAAEKSRGFPWLGQAYADYFYLQDLKTAKCLRYKPHPARKAADHLTEIASQRRIAEKLYRVLKYQLDYYENLFPWLVDFKGEDIDDLIEQILDKKKKGQHILEESDDPAKKWLTSAEYARLPSAEKYQLALNRYWQKKKSKWEVGRGYERYVGYLYEKSGCSVYYQGIVEGLADLGRDLIVAKKDGSFEIVQCKCWSQEKTVHEKHVFQLFGTTVEYWLKNSSGKKSRQLGLFPELMEQDKINATFITSTKLSEKARDFAAALRIQVLENFPLQRYPSVKCNVSRRTGEKIYHLPFDQQYDRTLVEEERNECYVETIGEAEELGFRRAFRWRG